jgi:hypothetical protein
MYSLINKKIYDFFIKTCEADADFDEIGERYSNTSVTTTGASDPNHRSTQDSGSALLLAPNMRNRLILENGFSNLKNTLLILSIFCCIVYRSDTPYNEICKNWGFPENSVRQLAGELVFGSFAIDNKLVIAFKGSSCKADFMTDIDFLPTDDQFGIPGKMHRGFYKLLFDTDNYTIVLRVIDSYPEDTPLVITGHSLGGGLASLFYAYLKTVRHDSPRQVELFTFGCPRSGNKEFTKFIENTTRITNCNDIVCRIPIALGYRHPNEELHLGSKNFFKFSTNDHHLTEYYKNILNMQNQN